MRGNLPKVLRKGGRLGTEVPNLILNKYMCRENTSTITAKIHTHMPTTKDRLNIRYI
ncbi:hypothetical protein SERLA73DRAFT_170866 [Serpula lacrymans var. lacrymans S7.3]|uniref:Uncharacterized protein n=1 Tax=Serpula lacrymans var. lacrymans (strain S7.3) TaxID=936435 RepID=F8Q8P6_SERL3|nr:hypothetical protein SERLA73DRAFT_170866 [Serpula lacrymans var. lacrymans S7.3]